MNQRKGATIVWANGRSIKPLFMAVSGNNDCKSIVALVSSHLAGPQQSTTTTSGASSGGGGGGCSAPNVSTMANRRRSSTFGKKDFLGSKKNRGSVWDSIQSGIEKDGHS